MADAQPLTDEERAELEALRAEKAAREERERAAQERAELEALRAESAQTQRQPSSSPTGGTATTAQSVRRVEDEEDRRIREARERGARLMKPDDDLRMPKGQKIVLAVLALLVLIYVVMTFFVR